MLYKGIVLFVAYSGLLFLAVLGFEYFLWLSSIGRLVLFMLFIGIGLALLYKFIFTPLLYLGKIKQGITNKDASLLIGKHFPEVADRLYNLLDLIDNKSQSELLLASIEQRSLGLDLVPFKRAVNYMDNIKYLRFLTIPLVLFALVWLTGNLGSFLNSYERVVHYDLAYEPPAPFRYKLLSNDLSVLNDKSYTITLTTIGDVRPDAVNIVINDKEFLLRKEYNLFSFTLAPPLKDMDFYFVSGDVRSKVYHLTTLDVPFINDFLLQLDYPAYTNKKTDVLKTTGNAILPEGTKVTWSLKGSNIDNVVYSGLDSIQNFLKNKDGYILSKTVYSSEEYQLSTSNSNIQDYEKLDYKFKVIKDAYPVIKVDQVLDSLDQNLVYYIGEASDDYSVSSVKLICYPVDNVDDKQVIDISRLNRNLVQFYYTFPTGLVLKEDTVYALYFLAKDNDAFHGGKTSKSQIFNLQKMGIDAIRKSDLEKRLALMDNLDLNLNKFREQKEALNELAKSQKEKKELNYNEQSKLKEFLNKQIEQESLMEKFSKQLKENLDKSAVDEEKNKLLKERLARQELEAAKNEKLLNELKKIADKINKEELAKRLEELGKRQANSERSLEQLLELTKRYYVTEKAAQLANELNKLSELQKGLADLDIEKAVSKEKQNKLNEDFSEIADELKELEKDNEGLKKPIDFTISESKKEAVKEDQKDALEELNKEQGADESSDSESKEQKSNNAKQKQKSAARKIQEMSEDLQAMSASGSGGSSIVEDAEMLRQILDNLVTFSFTQENLFNNLEELDISAYGQAQTVREEKELRSLFEHVDDSLFSLSLRRAELSEFVNEQITEVYYNIDKSLESLAENQKFQGISYQKYVLSASNSLADFLINILDNMQQSMSSGSGSGKSKGGFQLPDIIKGQSELKDKMEGQGKSEKKGNEGEGQNGKGAEGKNGQKGEEKGSGEGEGGLERGAGKSGNEEKTSSGNGSNSGSNGNKGSSEQELKEIYEIYKEQQVLRGKLEEQLANMISNSDRRLGEKLVKQMEDFENDLLENGITRRTLDKINTIEHELLKLEGATLKKGESSQRKSSKAKDSFSNPILSKPSILDNYHSDIEVLNRQTLPLRQIFRNRVKDYFKTND